MSSGTEILGAESLKCRNCKLELSHLVLDLGFSPPSNSFLSHDDLNRPEVHFPLRVYICSGCWLIQTADYVDESLMFPSTYVYFSSTSTSWLEHAKEYVHMITKRASLTPSSFVVEIASNDGYLLKNFNELQIPNLGIEPTSSTADIAEKRGVQTLRQFFSDHLAKQLVSNGQAADLIVGNNVYAHVPDINDFTGGMATLLKKDGVITLEFPHAINLIIKNQFDTVYHEHFSYLTLGVVQSIFEKHGMRIFDVEQIDTHGGSLRIYGCLEDAKWSLSTRVDEIFKLEEDLGMRTLGTYSRMQSKAVGTKNELLYFLMEQKRLGHRVFGYGAAAKGNTLLNFAGVGNDLIEFVVDGAESKQGKFLPGSHIPVKNPLDLVVQKNDNVIIFPWNIATEVAPLIRSRFGEDVRIWTAIPTLVEI